MTAAEARAIVERHVLTHYTTPDDVVGDCCREDGSDYPCDAHRAATAYLASVAVVDKVRRASADLLNDEMSDLEHYHMDGQFREFAKRVRAALADVAAKETP